MFNGQTPTTQMKAALWLESQPELVSHCFPIQKVKAKGPKESSELKFFTQNRFYEIVHSGLRNAKDSDQGPEAPSFSFTTHWNTDSLAPDFQSFKISQANSSASGTAVHGYLRPGRPPGTAPGRRPEPSRTGSRIRRNAQNCTHASRRPTGSPRRLAAEPFVEAVDSSFRKVNCR